MIDGGNFNASDAVIALGVRKKHGFFYPILAQGVWNFQSRMSQAEHNKDYLFDESEGVDKYIESLGTLWLLHYLLVSLKEATLYHITFVQFQKERKVFEEGTIGELCEKTDDRGWKGQNL